jgi:hypothetical protein
MRNVMIDQVVIETSESIKAVRAALKRTGTTVEKVGKNLVATVHESRDAVEEVTNALNDAGLTAYVLPSTTVEVLMAKAEAGDKDALDELEGKMDGMSHDADCSYRHKGECDCTKNDIRVLLNALS